MEFLVSNLGRLLMFCVRIALMPSGTGTIFFVSCLSSTFLVFVNLLAGREALFLLGACFFSGGGTHFFSLAIELVRLFDRYGYCCFRTMCDYTRALKKPRLA